MSTICDAGKLEFKRFFFLLHSSKELSNKYAFSAFRIKSTAFSFATLFFSFAAVAAQPSVPVSLASTDDNAQDPQPNSVLGAAALNITDQLNLVTTSIFSGGTGVAKETLNVFITSTLAASKPAAGTSTKYQDVELLMPHGGVLNLLLSYGSVNYANYSKYAEQAMKASKNGPGREQISDRLYRHIDEAIDNPQTVYPYITDGVGIKMINRNTDTSTAAGVSNYGLTGTIYLGGGFDGTLNTSDAGVAGNFRAEVKIQASWTDKQSMASLYPDAVTPKMLNYGVEGNFQLAITNKLSVNVQAGWPIGASKNYAGKVLLAGITLTR